MQTKLYDSIMFVPLRILFIEPTFTHLIYRLTTYCPLEGHIEIQVRPQRNFFAAVLCCAEDTSVLVHRLQAAMISWRRLSFQRTTHATWTWCLTAQYALPTFVTFSYFFRESWMTLSYFVQPRYHDAGYVALLRCPSSNADKVLIPDCLNFINGGKATLWKQMSYAAVWIAWVEGKFQWLWPEREMRCVTWDLHVECVRITGSDLAKDAWCKEEATRSRCNRLLT